MTCPKEDFNAITGKGIEADVESKRVQVVSPGYVKEQNIDISPAPGTVLMSLSTIIVVINA